MGVRATHIVPFLTGMIYGCAPMESAPLIYVSKATAGVNVTAGQPEQPGLAVVLGYGGTDAAYVPVAVAKYCPQGQTCTDANYKPIEVKGSAKESSETESIKDRIKALDVEIHAAELQRDTARTEADKANNELKQSQIYQAALNALTAQKAALQDEAAKATVQTQIEALGSKPRSSDDIKADITKNNGLLRIATDLIKSKSTARDAEIARLAGQGNEDRSDSYSVYGSFNSDSRGGNSGANLVLGKVFSTGVAAQNLTSGIRAAAVATQQAQCLENVKRGEASYTGTQLDEYRTAHLRSCTDRFTPP